MSIRFPLFKLLLAVMFCVPVIAAPAHGQNQGEWAGVTNEGGGVYFAVSDNSVQNFQSLICLSGGAGGFGCFENVITFGLPISGNSFSYTGPSFELSGTFTTATTCNGTWRYRDGYMGYGNGTWTASFGAPPVLYMEPMSRDFGEQAINTEGSPFVFSITNKGGGLATGTISLTGADSSQFEITAGGGSFSLAHDQGRQISVRFKPTVTGQKTALLTADGIPPANDIAAPITGNATHPILSAEPIYRDVSAGGGTATFAISNTGTGTLSWAAAVSPSSPWLSITGKSSGTGSGIITVAFEPNYGIPSRAGVLTVTADGAGNSPLGLEVRQSEGLPSLVYTPASHDFGKTMVFTSSDEVSFSVTNQGGGIAAGSISLTGPNAGEFEVTSGGGGFSLAHNEGRTVSARFRPASMGSKTSSLTAFLDSFQTSFSASLAGTGTRPEWKLAPPEDASEDHFGSSVAIDGDFAIVGTTGESSSCAYIFERSGEEWIQRARLTAGNAGYDNIYGWSVDISGNYAIAGGRWVNERGSSAGMACIFERPASGWTDMSETARLFGDDTVAGDFFGGAVAISGNNAVVGAPGDDDKGNSSGSAYVFERTETGWNQVAKLKASDGTSSNYFGDSVGISGDTVIVGAPWKYDNYSYEGAAYVFQKPQEGWSDMTETVRLRSGDPGTNEYFGGSVSISGELAIVGARGDYSGSYRGAAYLFGKGEEGWPEATQKAKLTENPREQYSELGASVDICGGSAIAGIPGDDNLGYSSNSGSAALFRKPIAGWTSMTQTARLPASDPSKGAWFGKSVGISGDYAIVSSSGSAYIFYIRNFPPGISDIPDQILAAGLSTGAIGFTIYDSETAPAALTVTVSSSDGILAPVQNILPGGTNSSRTVTVTPAKGISGTANITVTVSDGEDTASETFVISVPDTDGDGLPDNLENTGCTDPADSDTDNDGLLDGIEDTDRDGEVDSNETDPCASDTDGDGLADGIEDLNKNGTVDPGESDPRKRDTDGDGLSDGDEDTNRNGVRDPGETDPTDWDTDGDSYSDQDERLAGSNPLSGESFPLVVCVEATGTCSDCMEGCQCFSSIQEGINHAVSQSNPAALVKVFKGGYGEAITIPAHVTILIASGPVEMQ